jgi:PadR family transcriptional regulator, regulatory protein PadR
VRRSRKHSRQTRDVLAELAREPSRDRYGYELAQATRLASGTLYPILMRLEERGLLEARWELERRPRHVYRLTDAGLAAAAAAAAATAAEADTARRSRSAAPSGKQAPA